MRLSLLIFFSLVLPSISLAAANYTVAPMLLDYSLEKRDIIQEKIILTNNENRILRFYITVNEIEVDSGGAIKQFVPPSVSDQSTTVTSWIEISRARIQLDPGETREIPLTIHVSPTVAAGQYHALIGFGTGKNRYEATQKVVAGDAKGVIVRIGIKEEEQEFLKLNRFTVDRFVTDSDTNTILYTLTNPSSVPVSPAGEIIFFDSRGIENGTIPVNPDGVSIASGESVTFESPVPDTGSAGRHKAFMRVDFGENLTASLNDTQFFYIVPIKQLVIIFVTILVLASGVTIFLHRRYSLSGDGELEDELGDDVNLYVRKGVSKEDSEHDLNLKQK